MHGAVQRRVTNLLVQRREIGYGRDDVLGLRPVPYPVVAVLSPATPKPPAEQGTTLARKYLGPRRDMVAERSDVAYQGESP